MAPFGTPEKDAVPSTAASPDGPIGGEPHPPEKRPVTDPTKPPPPINDRYPDGIPFHEILFDEMKAVDARREAAFPGACPVNVPRLPDDAPHSPLEEARAA